MRATVALAALALILAWAGPADAFDHDLGPVAVPEPSPAAIRHHRSGLWLHAIARVWGVAVPAALLFSGWSSRLARFARGRVASRPWVVAVGLYGVLFLGVQFAADLPLRFYAGFLRPHEYGLSRQSIGRWLGQEAKGLGIEMAGAALFLWVPYLVIARSPRRWWLGVGLLTLPFAGFLALITPVAIDPLFHDFGPMRDKPLEARIDALARRSGIDGARIFEVDQGRDTTTVNAYVTGLLGTKRIVLWDTLIDQLDPDEVAVVMGHEMGHYVLNHVALGLALSSVGTIFALFLIHHAATALVRRHHARFGFDRLADVASVPLILLLAQVTMYLGAPATNAVGRWMEHEADRFALEITRANHAAATGFIKLQRDNLAIPDTDWYTRVFRSTHPPIGDRIRFCNDYHPWRVGEPSRYGPLFREP